MGNRLSQRQADVLEFVRSFVATRGRHPKYQELVNGMSLTLGYAHELIKRLRDKGYLLRGDPTTRGNIPIYLTERVPVLPPLKRIVNVVRCDRRLNAQQRGIIRILATSASNGFLPPKYDAIASRVGLSLHSSVSYHVGRLIAAGYLAPDPLQDQIVWLAPSFLSRLAA
ncbi:hypothetical protein HY374_00825 [Candidatus Berkelbacteria bacterium]|nr:hypothetical protein [Candidatus Berkelbacteria bacterium]